MNVDPKIAQAILTGAEQTDSPAHTPKLDEMIEGYLKMIAETPGVSPAFSSEFAVYFRPLAQFLHRHSVPVFISMQLGDLARAVLYSQQTGDSLLHMVFSLAANDARRNRFRLSLKKFITALAVDALLLDGVPPARLMGLPELPSNPDEAATLRMEALAYMLSPYSLKEVEDNILPKMVLYNLGAIIDERNINMGDYVDGAE